MEGQIGFSNNSNCEFAMYRFMAAVFSYFFKDAVLDSREALFLVLLSVPATLFSYSTRCRERRIAQYIAIFLAPVSPWSQLSYSSGRLGFFQRTSIAIVLTVLLFDAFSLAFSFPSGWSSFGAAHLAWVAAGLVTACNCVVLYQTAHLPDYSLALEAELSRISSKKAQ
jgi:hypothetical protein